jgi:septum formation protein
MQQPSNIIYLASKSPRRRELLKQIGVHYELLLMREVAPRVDIDESPRDGESPHAYVERVVALKAETAEKVMLERKLPTRPILTADTTVTFDGEILGKPATRDDAVRTLKRLAGETHQVLTAVMVKTDREAYKALTTSFVTFAPLTDDEIRRYVDTGEPMDKAGAYGVQGRAARFISKLSGSYSGVVGLPLYETAGLLRQSGIQL